MVPQVRGVSVGSLVPMMLRALLMERCATLEDPLVCQNLPSQLQIVKHVFQSK